MLTKILDYYWYYVKGMYKYEIYLSKYQGYGNRNILQFKRQNNLDWQIVKKLLSNLIIIDGLELRNHIRAIYESNKELFENPKTYISQFGPLGKSSGIILNQFLRCYPGSYYKLKPAGELQELTEGFNVIFLDDFIGSGQQAIDYIKVISRSLNSSVKAYLFTIAATEKGLQKIRLFDSKFTIESSITFTDQNIFLLHEDSTIFDVKEKKILQEINKKLGFHDNNDYHLGIPFSFFYSTPDNSMGLLWADKVKYNNSKNERQEWYGLTPREY